MCRRWIIADTHFGHSNILKYESRPFPDVESMDYQLIARWNNTVKGRDTVYVLGDFAICGKARIYQLLSMLNGTKVLIIGNHDKHKPPHWWREAGFKEVYKHPIIINDYLILSHQPVNMQSDMPYINIHGHLHSKEIESPCYCSVSSELTNYTPVNLDLLAEQLWKVLVYRGNV